MSDLIVTYGNPESIKINYTTGLTEIFLSDPGHNDIFSLWKTEFSILKNITVALSGGLDSQFAALVAKQSGANVRAKTYELVWEDNVINSYDVLTARDFCKKHNIPFDTVRVDIKRFLDELLVDYCKKYRVNSPQLAVQIYGTQHILDSTDDYVLTGGDIAPISFSEGRMINLCDKNYRTAISAYTPHKYKHTNGPFMILSHEYDNRVIRDPFMMTSEIQYLGFLHHETVMRESNVVLEQTDYKTVSATWTYKKLFYQAFGFDYIIPLHKRTGFELLKSHLASETGFYDEFDKRYRDPLLSIVNANNLFGPAGESTLTKFVGNDYPKLMQQLQSTYEEIQPVPARPNYIFDW